MTTSSILEIETISPRPALRHINSLIRIGSENSKNIYCKQSITILEKQNSNLTKTSKQLFYLCRFSLSPGVASRLGNSEVGEGSAPSVSPGRDPSQIKWRRGKYGWKAVEWGFENAKTLQLERLLGAASPRTLPLFYLWIGFVPTLIRNRRGGNMGPVCVCDTSCLVASGQHFFVFWHRAKIWVRLRANLNPIQSLNLLILFQFNLAVCSNLIQFFGVTSYL